MSKLKNGQNLKFLQSGTKILHKQPISGRENLSKPRLGDAVSVTSKLHVPKKNYCIRSRSVAISTCMVQNWHLFHILSFIVQFP